jgi:hypothetical protein
MQSNESISISELLIAIKWVLNATNWFEGITDENLEIFIERLVRDFIHDTVEKAVRDTEKNEAVIGSEGDAFISAFQHHKVTSVKAISPTLAGIAKEKSVLPSFDAFSGVEGTTEKKYRIFKWKMLQKHKMSLLYVKDKLIESMEVLMFFNAINPIKTCLFSWGYNGHYQNGVQFTQSIREFYDQEVDGYSYQKFVKPKLSSYTVGQNRGSSHNISQESSEELIVTEKTKFQETKEQDIFINKMADFECEYF